MRLFLCKQEFEVFKLLHFFVRWMMNEDQMATDKLSEGIRKFAADQNKMDAMVRKLLQGWTHQEKKILTINNPSQELKLKSCRDFIQNFSLWNEVPPTITTSLLTAEAHSNTAFEVGFL